MDKTAFYQFSYGLCLLTARQGDRDNGCIVNTAMQVASDPLRVAVSVIRKNLSRDMVLETGRFNLSVLTERTPFEFFQHFGMRSGRDADKYAGDTATPRLANGLRYVPFAAAAFACTVVDTVELGSHTLFIASVDDALRLWEDPPMTYAYYQSAVKPKPAPAQTKGWRCKVCGYVYEGETLPPDFECPLCHHGPDDFERI